MNPPSQAKSDLKLLSIVIPARDEEGCIASTVEHLHLELWLNHIAHEIVVVDDGSTDGRGHCYGARRAHPESRTVQNRTLRFWPGNHLWTAEIRGDAVVIMMADESDDCRDVVRYWQALNEVGTVFGSRFMRGGGVIDYPWLKLR